jgi:D-glycero-alpha-D-manno-heptose-7-phosphate kinase
MKNKFNFNSDKYVINEKASVKEALLKVEDNHYGMIFTKKNSGKIVGLATDGDIRRALLRGITLDDSISNCVNNDFVWADAGSSREQLIKRLDSHINYIPILDKSKKLVSIISRDYLPLDDEKSVYIRSRAPVRVSFGGGGSDLTHYFENNPGAVINSAISIYSHAAMKLRSDSKILIKSQDLNAELKADDLSEALSAKGEFGLIQSILKVVQPKYGFELYLNSDFPVGSGLGGSATLSAAILGCFNMLRKDQWNQYEIAEIAFQAERLNLGIAGGWQDQYAAVFGGFNFIEFNSIENIVNPIRVHHNTVLELEESLVLCNTGIGHNSGNIHRDQKTTMSSKSVKDMVKKNVDLTYETRNLLLRGELEKFGECLDAAWKLKRNFSNMISNKKIDSIYNGAIKNGAVGGKLLGAGGGGFFIFYVPPFQKHKLITFLNSKKLDIQNFRFEPEGLKTWTSRGSSGY